MGKRNYDWKRDLKTVYRTDSEWLTTRKDGSAPLLEIAEEVGTRENEAGETETLFQVFRVEVERFKLTREPEDPLKAYLVPHEFDSTWPHHPRAYEPWFASRLEEIARTVGQDPVELARDFTSADPKVRAAAYVAVAGCYGWREFDDEPLELTESELDERWA